MPLRTSIHCAAGTLALVTTLAWAQDADQAVIQSATSAAPPSITENATIMNWPEQPRGDPTVVRQGSNGWTCLPDMPDTPGTDPMCLDEPWMKWVKAWQSKSELNVDQMGFGYMLQGGTAESNTDPYATGPTETNEWMEVGVPHLMILVPDKKSLEGIPTDPNNGGPWVMWRDTPYAHIMVPMPKYQPENQ